MIQIKIFPHATDDWTVTSPFDGEVLDGVDDEGFFIANKEASFLTNFVRVERKLVSSSTINQGLNLMSTEPISKGIGGSTKTPTYSFTLENVSGTIDFTKLLGRQISVLFDSVPVFTGSIYECVPDNLTFAIYARGNKALWDKEVGTLAGSALPIYSGGIYPITYGDFTVEESPLHYLPLLVQDADVLGTDFYIDSRKTAELGSIACYDPDMKEYYAMQGDPADLTSVLEEGKYNTENLVGTVRSVESNPAADQTLVVFTTEDVPYYLMSFDENATSLVAGAVYWDGDSYFHYVESTATGVYKFYGSLEPGSSLTKTSGTGPSSLTVAGHSEEIRPSWFAVTRYDVPNNFHWRDATIHYEPEYGPAYDASNRVNSKRIRIEDETLLIVTSLPVTSSTETYTLHYAFKAIDNSDSREVSVADNIYAIEEAQGNTDQTNFFTFEAAKRLNKLSNFRCLQESSLNAASGHSVILLDACIRPNPVSRLGNIISNFEYQVTDNNPFILSLSGFTTLESQIGQEAFYNPATSRFLSMDMSFDKFGIDGNIKNMWLLGNFEGTTNLYNDPNITPRVDFLSKAALELHVYMRTVDSYKNKLIGVNLQSAAAYGVGIQGIPPSAGFTPDFVSLKDDAYPFHGDHLYSIISIDRKRLANNPPRSYDIAAEIKSFSLLGAWDIDGEEGETDQLEFSYGTYDRPNYPETLQAFQLLTYGLVLRYAGIPGGVATSLSLHNIGILFEFDVDINKTKLWGRGKGRVDADDGDSLIEHPADVVEDLLIREGGVSVNTSSFATAKSAAGDLKIATSEYEAPFKLSKLVDTVCKNSAMVLAEDGEGKPALHYLGDQTVTHTISDSQILLDTANNVASVKEFFMSTDSMCTKLQIKYAKRYADNLYSREYQDFAESYPAYETDFDAAKDVLGIDRQKTLELDGINRSAIAAQLASVWVQFHVPITRGYKVDIIGLSVLPLPGEWLDFSTTNYVKTSAGKKYLITDVSETGGYGAIARRKTTLTILEYGNFARDIQETGTAADTIVESGSQPDTIVEHG